LVAMRRPQRNAPAVRVLLVASIAIAASFMLAATAAEPLRTIKDVPLDIFTRRFAAQSLDRTTGVLFIADTDGGRLIVFDTRRSRVIRVIASLPSARSVLAIPSEHRIYVSEPASFEVAVIDSRSYAIVAHIPAGRFPNSLAWDSAGRKLYVSDEIGETETVIDAAANRVNAIPLGGEAGASQYDSVERLIYVNVKTRNELVAIDPVQDAIVARYPLAGCSENVGLLIDDVSRVAYVACHANARILSFDLRTHRVRETQGVAAGPSTLAWDSAAAVVYVFSEGGHLALFDVRRGLLQKNADGALSEDVFGASLNPVNHRIYFALHDVTGKAILRIAEAPLMPASRRATQARSRPRLQTIPSALQAPAVREKSGLPIPLRLPAR
jgi:DNA-binding beta-propeller fold protein YncE